MSVRNVRGDPSNRAASTEPVCGPGTCRWDSSRSSRAGVESTAQKFRQERGSESAAIADVLVRSIRQKGIWSCVIRSSPRACSRPGTTKRVCRRGRRCSAPGDVFQQRDRTRRRRDGLRRVQDRGHRDRSDLAAVGRRRWSYSTPTTSSRPGESSSTRARPASGRSRTDRSRRLAARQ
jgi:hypothetical protein